MLELRGPGGVVDRVQVQPSPVQAELPLWLTVMGNPDSWDLAARSDLGVFTNMIGRSPDALGSSVAAYQRRRAELGLAPGRVTVMLHAHVDQRLEAAHERARPLLERYLAASAALFSGADATPRIRQRIEAMSDAERAAELSAIARVSAERYLRGTSLVGDIVGCREVLDRFGELGVTEIACLVDFGPERDEVLASIRRLSQLIGTPATRRHVAVAAPAGASR